MSDRRVASSSLSSRVIDYLCERGHSQNDIARMLRVSAGFVSLVRSRERSLTIDHLERLADAIKVPLGAFLIAATSPGKVSAENRKLFEASEAILLKADSLRNAIVRGKRPTTRKSA